MPTSAAYVWAIPLLQRLMHVNAASNEQVQLFIHELIDPFQSSTLIIGEQMVSTRRAPCESRGVTRGVGEAGKSRGKGNGRRLKKRKEPVARGSIPPRWFTGLNIPSCFASFVFAN